MKSIDVQVGGRTLTVRALRGLSKTKAFDDALREEFKAYLEDPAFDGWVTLKRLLKLGVPGIDTFDFSEATRTEFLDVLEAALELSFPLEGSMLDKQAETQALIEAWRKKL